MNGKFGTVVFTIIAQAKLSSQHKTSTQNLKGFCCQSSRIQVQVFSIGSIICTSIKIMSCISHPRNPNNIRCAATVSNGV